MATGPEHYSEAERLAEQADTWMDADRGWKAGLSSHERIQYRTADLLAGLLHAFLANAAATALNDHSHAEGGMRLEDYDAWMKAASAWQPKPKGGEPR
ncbi:hypothetical protein ACWD25_20690 [Streptomyces sp. NPDC002920]